MAGFAEASARSLQKLALQIQLFVRRKGGAAEFRTMTFRVGKSGLGVLSW